MTKNETISLRILALIATGMAPVAALRAVVGDAAADHLIDTLYHGLRAQAGVGR